jgi:hypothetical protein
MVRTLVVLLFTSLCISLPLPLMLVRWVEAQSARPAPAQTRPATHTTPHANPFAEALASFHTRIDGYLNLRKARTQKFPEVKETGDPAKISSREKALGQAIAMARATANTGDVFGPDMTPHLKRILAEDWRSRSAADRKAIFSELPKGVTLGINQPYPTTLPLLSVPAKLLAQLPMLPEELEYRLIDQFLLLRDRDANLIIDLIPDVLPNKVG